jgi:hypothetical protein
MPRVASALSFAAITLLGSFLAGCGGTSASANGCGTHQYSYVGAGTTVVGGAPWYAGVFGGGWYDPGDDGSDYAYESSSYGSGSNGDDGSGSAYSSGSGDDGSGDDGSYDNGSDDGSGSSDDGSGDDGSGDDGSGDDGTASKKHLHTTSVPLRTQSGASSVNACYAYSCNLLCAVGSPASAEREARGYSSVSANDACSTAAHGVETWAHDTYGSDVSACKVVTGDEIASSTPSAPHTPAAPSVVEGLGASSSSSGMSSRTIAIPTIR